MIRICRRKFLNRKTVEDIRNEVIESEKQDYNRVNLEKKEKIGKMTTLNHLYEYQCLRSMILSLQSIEESYVSKHCSKQ